ncbi:MAG: YgfZ/GcvT domain-containing protein [Alphaproteobacteria bacterium]
MSTFFVTLKNRGLIKINGKDRKSFLQGLITNDIEKLSADNTLYACLLTPQGKFLHDFFVIEHGNEIWLDCEGGTRAIDLHRRLSMYRLRADVEIAVEEENTVYGILEDWNAGILEKQHSKIPTFQDSRHSKMGHRTFEKPNLPERPFEEWDYHRITLTIPDGSRDLIIEKSTLAEANMDTINAIDYDKGCYIGQELTARMHYRGLGKKHLKTISSPPPSSCGSTAGSHDEQADPAVKPQDDIVETRSSCKDIAIALVKI